MSYFSATPSVAKETVTQPRVGPQAQPMRSLQGNGGSVRAPGPVQADGDLERGDPHARGGRFAAGRWAALVRTHRFPQSCRKPTLGHAPQIQGGGSRGQRVCVGPGTAGLRDSSRSRVSVDHQVSSRQECVSGHWQSTRTIRGEGLGWELKLRGSFSVWEMVPVPFRRELPHWTCQHRHHE